MPPSEARRRTFGNLGKHREGLRAREEKRGARRLRLSAPDRCIVSRRDAACQGTSCQGTPRQDAPRALRQLRDVAFARDKTAHGARAQAIDQAVDQGLCRHLLPARGETCLRRQKRLGNRSGKRHQVDAEAHVDPLDLVLEQIEEMLSLARRRTQARLDHGGGAVAAAKPKAQAPCAVAFASKHGAKLFGEIVEAGHNAFMGNERLGKWKSHRKVGCGPERRAFLLALA